MKVYMLFVDLTLAEAAEIDLKQNTRRGLDTVAETVVASSEKVSRPHWKLAELLVRIRRD